MKFICQKDDLMQGLSIASKASATRSPQPVLECVCVSADLSGVRLQCTDLQMGIETAVPAMVAEEGRVLLSARLLNEIVRKLPSGEVTVSVNASNRATISAGGSKTTLQGASAEDFPALPAVPRLPEKAARGARRTARVALAVFAAALVLGAVLSMVSAGALEFWHAWGWFGFAA